MFADPRAAMAITLTDLSALESTPAYEALVKRLEAEAKIKTGVLERIDNVQKSISGLSSNLAKALSR